MINSLIGAIVKTAVIFLLASQPSFGIMGVAIGLLSWICPCYLTPFCNRFKTISFTFYVRDYVKTFFVMGISGWSGSWLFYPSSIHFALSMKVLLVTGHHHYLLFFSVIRFITKRGNESDSIAL